MGENDTNVGHGEAVLILGASLLVAALPNGGIYQVVVTGAGSGGSQEAMRGMWRFEAYRLNRFTGDLKYLRGYRFIDAVPAPQPAPAPSN